LLGSRASDKQITKLNTFKYMEFVTENVTGFEKTRLPLTQYQTCDFTRNRLLAQYTIIFHCRPCTSLVSFLRPCVSTLAPLDGHGSLALGLGGPQRAGQCLLSSIWTRKVHKLDLSPYSILYSYIKPTHHPYYYHLQYYYHHA